LAALIVECGVEQEEQLVGCVAYLIAVTTLDQHLVCEPAHLPTAWLLSGLLLFNTECWDGLAPTTDGILAKYTTDGERARTQLQPRARGVFG
jgi:hypothetical protein